MSQVKWNKQLVLASVLLVLGGAAYWLEFKQRPKKEDAQESSKRPFNLKDAAVESMRLAGGSRKATVMDCADIGNKLCKPGDNSKWMLREPLDVRADDGNANSLVSGLNNLTASEVIDLKEETPEKRATLLKEYGLDPQTRATPATYRVGVKVGGKLTMLYLGLNHPIGEGIFALVETDGKPDETKVYLVPNYFKGNFEHDLSYWRDKKLFSVAAHLIKSFVLDGAKGKVRGTKQDGQWTVQAVAPNAEALPGDLENIDSLLAGALYINAKGFRDDSATSPKAQAALRGTKTLLTLTLEGPDPKPIVFKVFSREKPKLELLATVSNMSPLYELDASARDRLEKSLKDLRMAKLVTSIERYTAKQLQFTGKPLGAQPITLVMEDGKWARPDKGPLFNERVQNFLDRISGNRIKDFLPAAKAPAGEADAITFTLFDAENKEKRKYAFWRASGNLYARDLLSKRKEIFQIDPATAEGLPWDPAFFFSPPPSPAPTAPDSHGHA